MTNSNPKNKRSAVGLYSGGAGFILLALSLLYVAFFLLTTRAAAQAPTSEPPLPTGVPQDVAVMPGTVEADHQAFLVCYNKLTPIKVEFEDWSSLKGWWTGSNATFLVNTPESQQDRATTNSDSWPTIILSQDYDSFTPWLGVTLFILPMYYHTWISASASLDIIYPAISGAITFSNKKAHFEREVQLFVISDEDLEMLNAHSSWTRATAAGTSGDVFGAVFFIVVAVFFILAGIATIMSGAGKR